jgi:RNA polymerase sigma factor (sigma-70 family)
LDKSGRPTPLKTVERDLSSRIGREEISSAASYQSLHSFESHRRMSRISPELVARLFDRHAAALELFAAQWFAAPADVVQEAYLQLVRQGRLPDRPVAWLYRVVRNGAISAARRDTRRLRTENAAIGQARLRFQADGESPLDAELAARALEGLPDEKREVVIARIWGGLSFEEIGEFAAISTSEAHRRYEAALASLRKQLGVTWLTKTATTKR